MSTLLDLLRSKRLVVEERSSANIAFISTESYISNTSTSGEVIHLREARSARLRTRLTAPSIASTHPLSTTPSAQEYQTSTYPSDITDTPTSTIIDRFLSTIIHHPSTTYDLRIYFRSRNSFRIDLCIRIVRSIDPPLTMKEAKTAIE